MSARRPPKIRLPKSWTAHVHSAVVHVISLVQYAAVYTRRLGSKQSECPCATQAENDRLQQEIALLPREEVRIKDARMLRISPFQRPHYPAVQRMAILELQAAHGWSRQQTADAFLVTAATIASWMNRLDEDGPQALVVDPRAGQQVS